MKEIEVKIIDMETDKELLINNLNLSERAKNILIRWLNIKTFGELLEIDYEKLKNTRLLGEITLNEIVTFVRKKGYFLKNENINWDLKRKKLKRMGFILLEDEDISLDLVRFLYQNGLFMLGDLKEYGNNVFKLKRMGKIRKKELEDFFKIKNIVLSENEAINTLEKRNISCESSVLSISINDIANLWYLSKDALVGGGILSLDELINIDYNELKEKIGNYIGYDNEILLEIVSFFNSYGISIKGYDKTVFGVKLLQKDNEKEIITDDIVAVERENLDIQVGIDRKKDLITRYNNAIEKHKSLLEEESKLDLEIMNILKEMEKVSGYGRNKVQ